MYCMLYYHLSSLICAKHGFKPIYNAVDKIGRFTFFGRHFFGTFLVYGRQTDFNKRDVIGKPLTCALREK